MAQTKADLASALAGMCPISRAEAKRVVEAFFQEIAAALERGEQVKLARFGIFSLREKRPRPGRNPKTGEGHTIAARRVVAFRPSDELKLTVEREWARSNVRVAAVPAPARRAPTPPRVEPHAETAADRLYP